MGGGSFTGGVVSTGDEGGRGWLDVGGGWIIETRTPKVKGKVCKVGTSQ